MKGERHIPPIVVMLLVSTVLSGCVMPSDEGETEVIDEEYLADENTVLSVVNLNGFVDIRSWNGDNVTLHAVKRTWVDAELLDEVDIVVTEERGELLIETVFDDDAHDVSVDITIQVPEFARVGNVTTSNGFITLSGTQGNSTLVSSNDWIDVTDVDGYIEATSNNGRIEIHRTTGIRNITGSNADINIEVRDLAGNTTITTSNGAIVVDILRDIDAIVTMTTLNGLIDFHEELLTTSLVHTTRVEGVMGEGGDTLTISTVNGDIFFYMLL